MTRRCFSVSVRSLVTSGGNVSKVPLAWTNGHRTEGAALTRQHGQPLAQEGKGERGGGCWGERCTVTTGLGSVSSDQRERAVLRSVGPEQDLASDTPGRGERGECSQPSSVFGPQAAGQQASHLPPRPPLCNTTCAPLPRTIVLKNGETQMSLKIGHSRRINSNL